MARSADSAINIDELQSRARRFLPGLLYDYLAGGVEDECGLAANRSAFERWRFLPKYMIDTTARSGLTKLFEQEFSVPFGIAPTGFAGLLNPGADLMLARAAESEGVPYIMSGVSNASLEMAAETAPTATWYQLYLARDEHISLDMAKRAGDAGIRNLVVTIDLPVNSKRERDMRNGFKLPPRLSPAIILAGLTHPRWTFRFLTNGGMPNFENWVPYVQGPVTALNVAQFVRTQSPPAQSWQHLAKLREAWNGNSDQGHPAS
ncbi:alpha-hydroxy acid oxidase [Mesorhizobium sp. SB112]|uniref:alpha-hydroxy acid oxidase n=1 Tax=Mesorhizobium sp. SB112 TaxID=3151853 RepID=UPI003263D5FC